MRKNTMSVRVAYGIALAMNQEMHSVTARPMCTRQQALISISLCNVGIESCHTSRGSTRSGICPREIRIGREDPSHLVVAGAIV